MKSDPKGLFKTSEQGGLDLVERRDSTHLPLQTGDPFLDRFDLFVLKFFRGNPEGPQHLIHIEIDQNRSLEEDGSGEFCSSGSRNLAALNFDVISRTRIGLDTLNAEDPGQRPRPSFCRGLQFLTESEDRFWRYRSPSPTPLFPSRGLLHR